MVDATTFSQIFTPVEGDYALLSLRRVVGCVVSSFYNSGTTCTGADGLIQNAAGFFNLAIVIAGAMLLTFTVMTQIFGGATEGQLSGGGAAGHFTMARVALGLTYILPVASGFSIIQILVLQLAVWSSGAGDNLWSRLSGAIMTSGYSSTANLSVGDARLRGMISNAIRVRAAGYLCQSRLNEIAQPFTGASPIAPVEKADADKSIKLMTFEDQQGFYNKSSKLCGSIKYTVASSTDAGNVNNPADIKADQVTYDSMRAIVVAALSSGLSGAWADIDVAGRDIANAVERRDDNAVNAIIESGVNKAESTLNNALKELVDKSYSNTSEVAGVVRRYINEVSSQGWALAVVWQRAGVNISQFYSSALSSLSFETIEPQPIQQLLQPMSRGWGWFGSAKLTGSEWRTIADKYERDMGYLISFTPVFKGFGQDVPTVAPSEVGATTSSLGVANFIRGLQTRLEFSNPRAGPDKWSDPLANLVSVGNWLSGFGLGILGVGAGVGIFGAFADSVPLASGVAELIKQASSAIWFIGVVLWGAGFWLSGVLPLVPLLYFFGAVISWIVVVLETLIAVPIWALTHFVPTREPSLIGNARQGYLLLLGIIARPTLIVFGLVASLLLMFVGFSLLNLLFRGVFTVIMPLDGNALTSLTMGSAAVLMYLVASTVLVVNSCSMISELGDVVLRWVDVNPNSLWNARFGAEAMQPINPAGNVAGTTMRLGSSPGRGGQTVLGLRKRQQQGGSGPNKGALPS